MQPPSKYPKLYFATCPYLRLIISLGTYIVTEKLIYVDDKHS